MALFGVKDNAKLFSAGKATATFGGSPAILLGVNVQVQRQLSPLPTLTSGIVWSAQPAQGTLTANSIISRDGNILSGMAADGEGCDPKPISIDMGNGACEGKSIEINIDDGFLSSVTVTANGNQGYIGADLVIQFTKCNIVG